jgi:hypothetical protein
MPAADTTPTSSGVANMRGLVGLLLTAGVAVAQEQPAAHTAAQPGSHGWPPLASPTVPPGQPSGVATQENRRPGSPIPQYPSATEALVSPADFADRPLPGSWADEFAQEYEQRQRLRTCDFWGNRFSLFPTSLLWAPPLADKRSPRLAAAYADDDTAAGNAFDATLGTTLGLLRVDRAGVDGSVQLDVFGAAFARLDGSQLVVSDYRAGIPLTFRRGPWFSKVAYEHTSSYLGNGLVAAAVFPAPFGGRYRKDEGVIGLGRWFDDVLRVYGVAAYAFDFTDDRLRVGVDDGDKRKQRYALGAEWFPWGLYCGGWGGMPFAAVHADFRGENDFSRDVAVQAGWQWRNPLQRLASVRVYAEYFSGRPLYGQLSRLDRTSYLGFGVAADY